MTRFLAMFSRSSRNVLQSCASPRFWLSKSSLIFIFIFEILLLFLQPNRHQWQIVFYIAAFINVFGMIFFLFFASGTEQKWNRPENSHLDLNINEYDAYDNPRFSLVV